jgi:hypothetical protein
MAIWFPPREYAGTWRFCWEHKFVMDLLC